MPTAASKREEIQLKLEILRQERERERQAFDELARENLGMTSAEVGQAAVRKAAESEPTSLRIGETVLRVGDYVQTIDDMSNLLREEKGIFIPDPVKQVYLGERGKITRVMPSFQGKSAVEIRFADGASKVFLTSCLDVEDKGRRAAGANSEQQQRPHCDAVAVDEGAPGSTPPSKPEPPPQPTWEMIEELRRVAHVRNARELRPASETKSGRKPSAARLPLTSELWNAATPAPPTILRSGGKTLLVSAPTTVPAASHGDPLFSSRADVKQQCSESLKSEGVSSLSDAKPPVHQLCRAERPSDIPTHRGSTRVPAVSGRKTQHEASAIDVVAPEVEPKGASAPSDGKCRSLPTDCPPGYQPKYSLNDRATGIPRLGSKDPSAVPKRCKVAGVLPGQTALQFKHAVFSGQAKALPCVMNILTQVLNWQTSGRQVKRLFTTDGVEIMCVDSITDGMCVVATTGHSYTCPSAVAKGPKASAAISEALGSAVKPPATVAPTKKQNPSCSSSTSASQPAQRSKPHERTVCVVPAASAKGMLKPISVRVFENGEYGDRKNDRFPFRTVTIRPAHKTMRAVMNTVERELGWHSLGRRVETIYDATGCEVTSVDQLTDGQALVASVGDRFVIPHASSVLHEEVMKLSATSDYLLDQST